MMVEFVLWMLAGCVTVFALVIPFWVNGAADLVLGKDDYEPPFILLVSFFSSILIAGIATGTFYVSLRTLGESYSDYVKNSVENQTAKVAPIPPQPETSTQSEIQWRIAEYERRGFQKIREFSFDRSHETKIRSTENAILFAQPASVERDNLWFRRGALLYDEGAVVDLKVAVLYGDECWQKNSVEHVAQKRRGRPVHIEKALNTPFLERSISYSHYAVCLGLASSESTKSQRLNEALAENRAANMCRAIANLEFKSPNMVRGVSLGSAMTKFDDPETLKRQRAIVIIGVDVIGELEMNDLIRASAQMITLDGVAIDDYSRSESGYSVVMNIGKGEYNGAKGLAITDNDEDERRFFTLTEPN